MKSYIGVFPLFHKYIFRLEFITYYVHNNFLIRIFNFLFLHEHAIDSTYFQRNLKINYNRTKNLNTNLQYEKYLKGPLPNSR